MGKNIHGACGAAAMMEIAATAPLTVPTIRHFALDWLSPRLVCATAQTVMAAQAGSSSSIQNAIPIARHAAMVLRRAKVTEEGLGAYSQERKGRARGRRGAGRVVVLSGVGCPEDMVLPLITRVS